MHTDAGVCVSLRLVSIKGIPTKPLASQLGRISTYHSDTTSKLVEFLDEFVGRFENHSHGSRPDAQKPNGRVGRVNERIEIQTR